MSYKETEAYKIHRKLGFPKIDDEIQLEILTTENYQPIMDLSPDKKTFIFGLLNEYITVTKKQLREHLIETNYIEDRLNSFSNSYDGFWLNKSGEKYVFFERERGHEFNLIYLNNLEEVLNHYVNHLGSWCK